MRAGEETCHVLSPNYGIVPRRLFTTRDAALVQYAISNGLPLYTLLSRKNTYDTLVTKHIFFINAHAHYCLH